MTVRKVISGGQTGVDRAALDLALERGMTCGGWCPKGRRAEDGLIPSRYPLSETMSDEYEERTEWNVRDADGTLILGRGAPESGTALTQHWAVALGKPWLYIDLENGAAVGTVRAWIESHGIGELNIAGPRESERPGIYEQAKQFLGHLLAVH